MNADKNQDDVGEELDDELAEMLRETSADFEKKLTVTEAPAEKKSVSGQVDLGVGPETNDSGIQSENIPF
jgi:hypothetical protein